jgi:hypothetical protein
VKSAAMPGIEPFIKDTAFDPEMTQIMGEAFERAAKGLHDRGQPAVVQEIIAKRIIDLAGYGERDPEKIANMALKSLGITTK